MAGLKKPNASPIGNRGSNLSTDPPATARLVEGHKRLTDPYLLGPIFQKQLAYFTRQLTTLLNAGIPILRSLDMLGSQRRPPFWRDLINDLADQIRAGATLAQAMDRYPGVFDRRYVKLVAAGETGGKLEEMLGRLADTIENIRRVKCRLLVIFLYPASVLLFAVFVAMFVRYVQGRPQPWALLAMPFVLVGVGYWAIKRVKRTEQGRLMLDQFKLKIPLIGRTYRKVALARFARTLGMLTHAGVPIIEALDITRDATGNEVVGLQVAQMRDQVRNGNRLSASLVGSSVIDPVVVDMIEVGEEAGELDRTLIKVADNFDEQVDMLVQVMTSLLKPLLVIILALVVGVIAVGFYSSH